MSKNEQKMDKNGQKWTKMDKNGQKWAKMGKK
jgi:flagellar biosynthesis chaperone FliJ